MSERSQSPLILPREDPSVVFDKATDRIRLGCLRLRGVDSGRSYNVFRVAEDIGSATAESKTNPNKSLCAFKYLRSVHNFRRCLQHLPARNEFTQRFGPKILMFS